MDTLKDTNKNKPGRGGFRPGAGRKTQGKIKGEIKGVYAVRFYPSDVETLIKVFGSLQKAVDYLMTLPKVKKQS